MGIKELIIGKVVRNQMPKNVVDFIDGKKTFIGLAGLFIIIILSIFGIKVPDDVIKIFEVIIGVGVADKIRKGTEAAENLKKVLEQAANELQGEEK